MSTTNEPTATHADSVNGELAQAIVPALQPATDLPSFSLGRPAQRAQQPPPNLFDNLDSLRLDQEFAAMLGASQPILRVPIRKPSKEAHIRVHPSADFRFATTLIVLKDEGEHFLVAPSLREALADEPTCGSYQMFTVVSRPGNQISLWPVRLPTQDGSLDSWNRSALDIATGVATTHWTRVVSQRAGGSYIAQVAAASSAWGDPKWPSLPFNKLMELAFKDRVITDLDHHILRRLRGEA